MNRLLRSALLFSALLPTLAYAQLEQHDFDIVVTSITGSGHPAPYSGLATDDTFQISIILDRSTPGTTTVPFRSRSYRNAIVSATGTIGGTPVDFVPQASSIGLTNDDLFVWDPVPINYSADCIDRLGISVDSTATEPDLLYYFETWTGIGIYYYNSSCPYYITGALAIPSAFTQGASSFSARRMSLEFGGMTAINGRVTSEVVTSLTPPPNDHCAQATVIEDYGFIPFDTSLATTDGSDLSGFCDLGSAGDSQIHNDVWFAFRPQLNGCTYISTLGNAFDTKLAVYESIDCPDDPAKVIACSSSEMQPPVFPFEAGMDVVLAHNRLYYIRVGGESVTDRGVGALRVTYGVRAQSNDGGLQPGAPGCLVASFTESCFGDDLNQATCTVCPCGNNASFTTRGGCTNSAGLSGRLLLSGSPSLSIPPGSGHDLRFSMSGATPDAFCFLASGSAIAPQNPANPCFGQSSGVTFSGYDGLRCAVQDVRRHGPRSSDVNGDVGVTTTSWGGANGPGPGLGVQAGFVAGETRHFQVIYRDYLDQGCMTGFNTSQAVTVTFQP